MKISNGLWVVGIGALHEIVSLLAGAGVIAPPGRAPQNVLAEILRGGVLGAVVGDPVRMALFWTFFFGLLLLMLGGLMHSVERREGHLPAALGWQLGVLGLGGGLLIPTSGFWLVLPVAWSVARGAAKSSANGPGGAG